MKVSIVIPVYNVENYLGQCLDSVQALTADVEAILVDDGSTDGSGTLCDIWAAEDSRFRVVHQANGGLSAARNTGIQHSTGDYILFLDSDDFLDPEVTDTMLEAGLASGLKVLVGRYQNYYEEGERYEEEDCGSVGPLKGQVPISRFLDAIPSDGASFYMIACRFIVDRAFLLENNLFFLPGIYHEDEEWTARLLCAAESVFVLPSPFYQYRQGRPGAIMAAVAPKHLKDSFQILERQHALFQAEEREPFQKRYLSNRMAMLYLDIMLSIYRLKGAERQYMYESLQKYGRFCVPNLSGKKGRVVRMCVRLLGLKTTCFLIRLARVIIRRKL